MTDPDEIRRDYLRASFILRRDSRVIKGYMQGSWDRDLSKKFAEAVKKLAGKFDGNPWGLICCLDDWQLSTHDSVPIIQAFGAWALANNVRQTALIYHQNYLKDYQLQQMAHSLENQTRYFADEPEAFEWLERCGFTVKDARCKIA